MHTEDHLFSVPNDCLWYDKLWGPSQRVVTLFLFVGKKSLKNTDFILVENQSLLNLPTIFATQMMFECFRMMVIVMINTVCPKISFWRKPI